MRPLCNQVDGRILRKKIKEEQVNRTILSFYTYHKLKNPSFFRDHMYTHFMHIGVLGRTYVSHEGINGQISVPTDALERLKIFFDSITFLRGIRLNYAINQDNTSFFKLIVRLKEKIVADGLNDATFDSSNKGKHLKAEEFNALVDQPNTIVVDMRNHYEWEVGHFKNAILPDVESFREALPTVEKILEPHKDKHIVMYCTGGIRCEKASAYYKHKGFKNVYQVEGGIIEYTRRVNQLGLENKFIGKNFVFDERLGEKISDDIISKCHQCGAPCDDHINCANDACHILFIQCKNCAEKYQKCCSDTCADFNVLPLATKLELRKTMTFNGTTNGKGRLSSIFAHAELKEVRHSTCDADNT